MCLFLWAEGHRYKNNILDFSAAGSDDKHMVDYQEIYNEAVSMFAAATGETMKPELLFIDKFTDLKLISDVMKRNRIPQAGVDLKHFEELDAELLFGGIGNVLVIRTDTGSDRQQLIHAILHQLARLYLRGREQIEFEPDDTFISVGHAIWSEVSAQLLARAIDDDGVPVMLYETDLIKILGDASPQNLAGYAVEILASYEGRTAKEWPRLQEEMQRLDLPQEKLIRILFEKIKSGDWDVDELWLGKLGAAYYIEKGLS